jgi:hypothetical protein
MAGKEKDVTSIQPRALLILPELNGMPISEADDMQNTHGHWEKRNDSW